MAYNDLGPKGVYYSQVTDIVSSARYGGGNQSGIGLPNLETEGELGIIRWVYDTTVGALKAFKFVKNHASAATLAAGNVVGFSDVNHTTVTTVVATYLSRNATAGVAVSAITAGNYGWVQCFGPATLNLKGGVSATKGDAIILSDTTVVVDQVSAGTAPTYKPLGYATANGSGAGGTVTVQLNCI